MNRIKNWITCRKTKEKRNRTKLKKNLCGEKVKNPIKNIFYSS